MVTNFQEISKTLLSDVPPGRRVCAVDLREHIELAQYFRSIIGRTFVFNLPKMQLKRLATHKIGPFYTRSGWEKP